MRGKGGVGVVPGDAGVVPVADGAVVYAYQSLL